MKSTQRLVLAVAFGVAFLLGACATAGAKSSAPSAQGAQPGSAGPGDKHAPILVGADILSPLPQDKIWTVLTALDNWGAWNQKVTKVNATPGLNVGTAITYGWEEREIQALVEELKEGETFAWRGARSGKDVLLRWQLRPAGGGNVLVSLRAVLKPGAGATPIANAGAETQAWMGALQLELNRLVEATKPAAKPSKKAP
jgi:hypothetical protein